MKANIFLTHCVLLLACTLPVQAADQTDTAALNAEVITAAKEKAEEQLDDGLKGFGYLAGLSHGCVAQNQKTLLEREVMDINAEIARALGIDRAFLFSAAFGYGTKMEIKTNECKEVLSTYEKRVAKFRASQGGKK